MRVRALAVSASQPSTGAVAVLADDQRAVARDGDGVARSGGDAGEPDRRAECARGARRSKRCGPLNSVCDETGDDLDLDAARGELRLTLGGRGGPESAAIKHGAAPPWDRTRRPARCARQAASEVLQRDRLADPRRPAFDEAERDRPPERRAHVTRRDEAGRARRGPARSTTWAPQGNGSRPSIGSKPTHCRRSGALATSVNSDACR